MSKDTTCPTCGTSLADVEKFRDLQADHAAMLQRGERPDPLFRDDHFDAGQTWRKRQDCPDVNEHPENQVADPVKPRKEAADHEVAAEPTKPQPASGKPAKKSPSKSSHAQKGKTDGKASDHHARQPAAQEPHAQPTSPSRDSVHVNDGEPTQSARGDNGPAKIGGPVVSGK
jgi:hypothetical protein